jgi:phosphoglycolate phosphatase
VRKPDGRVVDEVIARLGEPVDEVFMVGDSAVDVETGRAAGARTIGCLWGLRGREELDRAGADVLVGHPREIPPVVLGRMVPR